MNVRQVDHGTFHNGYLPWMFCINFWLPQSVGRNHYAHTSLRFYIYVQRRARIYSNFRRATNLYFSLYPDKILVWLYYKKDFGLQSLKSPHEGTFSRLRPYAEYIPRCLEVKDTLQLWYWWLTADRESALIITVYGVILLNDVFYQGGC
jgi:hypothetical protein